MQQSKSNVRNKIKIILQWSTFFNVSEKDASRVSVCSPQGVSKKNVTTLVSILGDPGAISGAEDKVKTGGKKFDEQNYERLGLRGLRSTISISSSLSPSFAKLVMSSAPAKSAGDVRYASQDPFIQSTLSHAIPTPICIIRSASVRRTQ